MPNAPTGGGRYDDLMVEVMGMVLPIRAPDGPMLVHCDAARTMKLVSIGSRGAMLESHVANLESLSDGRELWIPTFNYDYCSSGEFDVGSSVSQVGPITEFYRTQHAVWRTPTPVFSVCGSSDSHQLIDIVAAEIDPFDQSSIFGELVARNGVIVWYGAPFASTTFIHHVERQVGGPVYRYDKRFVGNVTRGEVRSQTTLVYHVRPLGLDLDYGWETLEAAARESGVLRQHALAPNVMWASARDLLDTWVAGLARDPLHLLSAESRVVVASRLDGLGRPFEIGDFE